MNKNMFFYFTVFSKVMLMLMIFLLFFSYFNKTINIQSATRYIIGMLIFSGTTFILLGCPAIMFYQINKCLYRMDNKLFLRLLAKATFFSNHFKYKLAWLYYDEDNCNMSLDILKNFKDNKSYYLIASNYEKLNEYTSAIEAYTKILTNDKLERPDILYNRGVLYKKTGNYDEAVKDLTNCIKCQKPDPKAYIALGVIKDELGYYEEAGEYFIKGRKLDGSFDEYIPKRYK